MGRSGLLLACLLASGGDAHPRDSGGISPRAVNLLRLIDPKRDTVQGEWKLEGGALLCVRKLPWARLQIPYIPPDEYDLTLVAERQEGLEAINIGLARGATLFHVVLDGFAFKGLQSGLSTVDGKWADANETTVKGQLFTNGTPSTVVCSVRKEGVKVTVDGRKVIDWTGEYKRLGNIKPLEMPEPRALYIHSYQCVYRFSRYELRAVSGLGKPLR